MKKIIFVNRFYWPDHSATSQILSDVTFKLKFESAEIHVITSRLFYSDDDSRLPAVEQVEGVQVHRTWTTSFGRANLLGRALDYISFYASSFFLMLSLVSRGDVLVAKTDPPLISVLSAIVVRIKGGILVNWLQDIFPEVAEKLGVSLFRGEFIYKIVKSARNWSLRVAERNVVLGEIMAEKIEDEISQPEKTIVIPNWEIGQEMQPVLAAENELRREWGLEYKFVVGYSGNLGRAHDYKTMFEAAKRLANANEIIFVFIGGGAGFELLRRKVEAAGLDNVVFKPYQPIELLSNSLSVPDVHLITLEPELEGLIVPSKFYGVISVGRPILYIGDENGEIARNLGAGDCGKTSAVGDAESLVRNIQEMVQDKERTTEMSANARKLYETRYSAHRSVDLWREGLMELI